MAVLNQRLQNKENNGSNHRTITTVPDGTELGRTGQKGVDTSENMAKSVFQALRSYRRSKSDNPGPLGEFALVAQLLQSDAAPSGPHASTWAVRRMLEEGVSELYEREPEMADLLTHRFFHGQSVLITSQKLGLSESSIYYRQKQAIQMLTDLLLTRESTLRENHIQNVYERRRYLPPPTYSRLFGLEEKRHTLQSALSSADDPWLISIVGMGGMGKTTLAHTAATWAAQQGIFAHVIWLTAKQEEYNTWRGERQAHQSSWGPALSLPDEDAQHALTYTKMLDAVANQLGLNNMARNLSPSESQDSERQTQHKQEQLRAFLSDQPALIVIDNLETLEDYAMLAEHARHLTSPSKLIFTSRYSVDLPGMLLLRMDELSWEDSLALLHFEAAQRGLSELGDAPADSLQPIYEIVGGNPLALKLVVGQLTKLPLSEVLERLKQAHKSSDKAEYELYYYLYREIWQLLSPQAREVMLTMPVLPVRGATWEDLMTVSGLPRDQLGQALTELVNRSLLNTGGWPEKLYSIHRLTHTFLMTEVLKWW